MAKLPESALGFSTISDAYNKLAGLLDRGRESVRESAIDLTSRIRYGVGPQQKAEMMYRRSLPGAPSFLEDPVGAERYTSAYLGGRKWGQLPAEFFNSIAAKDFLRSPKERERVRGLGSFAAAEGARAADKAEEERRKRLLSLFGPPAVGKRG